MGKSSGGVRGAGTSSNRSGYAMPLDSKFQEYTKLANDAIKEMDIKGEVKIGVSTYGSEDGYALQNIINYESGGNPFRNEIRIKKNSKQNIGEVIRHELRHISQGQKGQYYIKKVGNEKFHFWEGKPIISQADFGRMSNSMKRGNKKAYAKYRSLPWERDAWGYQGIK